MQDSIEFQRNVARFTSSECGYIVDILRGVYKVLEANDKLEDGMDSEGKLLLGDFIEALDECSVMEVNLEDDD